MKRVCLFMVMMMLLCLSACGKDRSSVKIPDSSPVVSEPQFETQAVFELTEQGKVFLGQMCRTLNDFDLQTTKDEGFWLDFLFRSYTGMGEEEETERINRGELGIEMVVKVSLERAKKRAKLVFGTALPDIRPSYEDMERGQYSCYYTDLVILDIMMPGISGIKTCEEIRKSYNVPILFLTARAGESDKLLGLMAGGDDYLSKPFSYGELLGRVKALIRRYRVVPGERGGEERGGFFLYSEEGDTPGFGVQPGLGR